MVPVDAPVVERMRAAGAIPIARTNLPDFGAARSHHKFVAWPDSQSWKPERTAGGSSGGEAAALASGMTPMVSATTSADRCANRRSLRHRLDPSVGRPVLLPVTSQ